MLHLLKRLPLFFSIAVLAFNSFAQTPATAEQPLIPPGTVSTGSLPNSVISNVPVGPGDILRITVFGQQDLSAVIGVNDKGAINLGLIGEVQVNGLRPSEIAKKVENAYRNGNYLLHPEISVETVQVRSQLVSILGEINIPGRYPIPGKLSLLELIATAGGLKQLTAFQAVVVRKDAKTPGDTQTFNIPLADTDNDSTIPLTDMMLESGDIVYIEKKKLFYIHGEVNRAGEYPMDSNMTVMKAISIGGGMNQRASTRRITIYRTKNGVSDYIDAKMNTPVEAGDVIDVKESIF